MTEMPHDVQCIALRQLETALHLYFEGEDYYSVITLAGASEELLGKLSRKDGNDTALEAIKKNVSAVDKAYFREDLTEKKIF